MKRGQLARWAVVAAYAIGTEACGVVPIYDCAPGREQPYCVDASLDASSIDAASDSARLDGSALDSSR
jgi:hypothetical protein